MKGDELLRRVDRTLERNTEAFDRNTAAFERNKEAFDRNTAAFERNKEAFDRNTAAFERHGRALDAFIEKHAAITQALIETVTTSFAQLQAEIADQRAQIQANTQALLRVLDRFGPTPENG